MSELDTTTNMLTIIRKLPYKLRDKWRTVACDIQEVHHHRAVFSDIVDFIEHQVKIVSDPVFGNIQDSSKPMQRREFSAPYTKQREYLCIVVNFVTSQFVGVRKVA